MSHDGEETFISPSGKSVYGNFVESPCRKTLVNEKNFIPKQRKSSLTLFVWFNFYMSFYLVGVGTYLGLQPPLHQDLLGPPNKMSIILQKVLHGIPLMMTISPNLQLRNC